MKKITVSKEIVYIIALAIDALGGCFSIHSGLGVTPMTAFPLVLNDIFPNLSVGTMNFIVQVGVLLLVMVVTRKFSAFYLTCYISAFIYDAFLDIFLFIFAFLPNNFILSVIYFILCILCIGVAVGFYMRCSMPLMPLDVIVKEFATLFKKKEGTTKVIIDLCFLVSAVGLSLIFFKEIRHVGLATFILAIAVGITTDISNRFFDKIFNYKCFFEVGKKIEDLTNKY